MRKFIPVWKCSEEEQLFADSVPGYFLTGSVFPKWKEEAAAGAAKLAMTVLEEQ